MPSTTLSSFFRFLRVLRVRDADVIPFVLRDGTPDPARRALMIRHRVTPELPDVVLYFDEANQVEGWWRSLGRGWKAKQEQLDAIARHYRDAPPAERASVDEWLALCPDQRADHPWSATLARIEQSHPANTAVLPKAWRSWTAREYIKSCIESESDDRIGDAIAARLAEEGQELIGAATAYAEFAPASPSARRRASKP
jgi:hypothetical protein